MDIEYTIDIDAIVAWNLYYADHSPYAKKWLLTVIILMIAIVLIFLLIGIKFINDNDIILAILLFYLALFPLYIAIFTKSSTKKSIIKNVTALYSTGKNGTTGKHHLSITPEYIKWIDEEGEGTTRWDIIEQVVTTDQYLFIIKRPSLIAITIPRKAFADDAAFNQFYETAKKYHQASLAATKTA
jgi:hypothetical protein